VRVLSLAPAFNTPGKHDATGAFQPEAKAFGTYWPFDNTAKSIEMRAQTACAIRSVRPDVLGFFCHGWKTGIQPGWQLQHVDTLAAVIAESCDTDAPIVALYACSTASGGVGGDGGFADSLRDALCAAGAVNCRVDAHDRPGHCTRNPYVRRFEGQGSPCGGQGGQWIVAPGSPMWKAWRDALRDTDLRLRFPLMTVAEIHKELTP
jgi:hypothetical protein